MGSYKKDVGVTLHKDHATFRVWAPFAHAVDVTGVFNNWGRNPMLSEGDGYWAVDIANVEAGQEYKFVIHTDNGEFFRNDPRALHMTTNKGNSVVVDTHFDWTDDKFVMKPQHEQVIYEVHVGTFYRPDPAAVGTFDDVVAKLDYLADLGITAIELMPIASMDNDAGWGYGPDYFYAVESLYGGRRDFMRLVNEAHRRDIAVILDVIYNHSGVDHNDLWQFDGWSQDGKGGIYFYNDWRSSTPWGDTRFDYGREEVRQFILDNAKMWLRDCHVDGLRVDSVNYIRTVDGHSDNPDNGIPEAWSLLQELTAQAREARPWALMIAEDIGGNEYITKWNDAGGAAFNAQWEIGFPWALRRVLDSPDDSWRHLGDLAGMLERRYDGDAFRRVIYSDSHDSAANGGARLNEEITPGDPDSLYAKRRSLIAAAVVLTVPGIPMLFQGQEFLQGGSFNDWRTLDWENAKTLSGIVLAYKHLIALRRNWYDNTRGLRGQSFTILHLNEETKVMAYHRWDQGGPRDDVIVVINFANVAYKDYTINLPRSGIWKVRFNSDWKGYSPEFLDTKISETECKDGLATVAIGPYSVLVLSQD